MNIETALLNRIKAEQAEYAVQALKQPGGKSEYDFGFRCGYLAGLDHALNTLFSMLDQHEKDGADL